MLKTYCFEEHISESTLKDVKRDWSVQSNMDVHPTLGP